MLSEIDQPLRDVLSALDAYSKEREAGRKQLLNFTDSYLDTVLDRIGRLPLLLGGNQAIAIGMKFSSFSELAVQSLTALQKRFDEIQAEQDRIGGMVDSSIKETEAWTKSALVKPEADLNARVSQLSKNFSEAVDQAKQEIEQLKKDASDDRAEIKGLASSSRKIAGSLASMVMVGSYRGYSLTRGFVGWLWDVVGVAVVGYAIVVLADYLGRITDSESTITDHSTTEAIARVGITGATFALAAYCFSRGKSNHAKAFEAKKAALRIDSVKAFINNQEKHVQDTLLQEMAKKMYVEGDLMVIQDRPSRLTLSTRFGNVNIDPPHGAG